MIQWWFLWFWCSGFPSLLLAPRQLPSYLLLRQSTEIYLQEMITLRRQAQTAEAEQIPTWKWGLSGSQHTEQWSQSCLSVWLSELIVKLMLPLNKILKDSFLGKHQPMVKYLTATDFGSSPDWTAASPSDHMRERKRERVSELLVKRHCLCTRLSVSCKCLTCKPKWTAKDHQPFGGSL